IPEYFGFGMSSGGASEKGCQATADAAYDELVVRRCVDPGRIVAAGWSLGGAVAVDLASRRRAGGLLPFCTFTNALQLARRLLPIVPVSLLLRHRFETLRKIDRVDCPVLVGHGRLDRIVPFDMGRRLAAAARGPVTTLWIDQADHNDFHEV